MSVAISPIESMLREQTGLPNINEAAVKKWQLARLIETLAYAREHSPYYKKRLNGISIKGLSIEAIFKGISQGISKGVSQEGLTIEGLSLEDVLRALPFFEKDQLVSSPGTLLAIPAKEVARVMTLSTSGTQGPPKKLYFSEADMDATVAFFRYGMSTMVNAGSRVVVFMEGGRPYTVGSLLNSAVSALGAKTTVHGFIKDLPQAAKDASEGDCFVGLPVQMLQLSLFAPHLRPRYVLLSADYVPKSICRSIEAAWQCDVLTHYGMTETAFGFGVQCAAKGAYHTRDAEFIIEIVHPETGEPMPHGEYGEVVITTITKRAMPLIRYRMGDIARMLPGGCRCGSNRPLLESVCGRKGVINGRDIRPVLDETMFAFEYVWDYNLNKQYGEWRLLVDTTDREVYTAPLYEKVKALLGKDFMLTVEQNNAVADAKKRTTIDI